MPALSFQHQFLNTLLRGDKKQTTRRHTDRIKVGDIAHIYIEQRRRITDKMMRCVTPLGEDMILQKIMGGQYPPIPDKVVVVPEYYAHFIGKLVVTDVYDIHPDEMSGEALETWARDDGFGNFDPPSIMPELVRQSANWWFSDRYGNDWMQEQWTVIRWDGWAERYFEPSRVI